MKKLVALVLSVILMLSALPLNVFAMDGNSIESISFEDTFIYDGTQENATEPRFFKTAFVITFENGNTYEGFGGEDGVRVNGEYIGYITYSFFQDVNLWEIGDVYEATASIAGVSGTYNVEVRENPIQEISIDDFNVVKSNICSSVENGEVYNIYNLMGYYRPYYVTYKDGSSAPVYGPFSTGEYTSVDLITTCVVPYEDWECGNTYEVTASLLGVADTFNVTVLEIESFEVEDVECIENFNGYMAGYWDENDNYVDDAWFNYNIYPENITVTFTNSLSISGNPSEISEYTGFYPNCYSDQSYENQWGLGNHTATINICGHEQNYTVKVVETPVERILVDDITYIEGTNGWVDHDTANPGWYCYDINPEELTVILKNGDEISGTLNEVCEQLGCWQNCTSDQSYNNQWSVGEHKATINLLGVTAEYKIIITESPVQSLEISDISIVENSKGYIETGFEESYYHYCYFYPDFSVTLKNGDIINSNGSSVEIGGEWYSLSIDESIQHNEHWTVGNTYEVTGSILGVSDTFNVTIKESPVESLSISDISIREKSTGWEEDGVFYYNFYPDYTITMKDGSVVNNSGIEIDGEWYSLSIDESIQYNEPWTVGNTYEVTGSILGVRDTFNVTITENPIESIVVDDIDVIVNTNGYYDSEYDCYIYSPNPTSFTAILKDGSQIKSVNGIVEIAGEHFGISSCNTNYWSQVENPWTVGNTYQMSASVGGFSDTFNVTITESPVVSIEVEDVTCIEGTRGQYVVDDGGYYFYDDIYFRLNYKVTLSDGSVLEASEPYIEWGGGGDHGVYINGEFYEINNVIDNQDVSHWSVGTHTATAEFMGVTDEFNVTITESPVESVRVEDITVINGIDSHYNGDFDYYNLYPTYTVTFKDGTEKTFPGGTGTALDGNYFSYLDVHYDQGEAPFEIGETYQIVGNFGLATDTFEVSVVENPVESFEVINGPDKTEYLVGEYYDLNGTIIRVHYNDNTYEDINIDVLSNGGVENYRSYFLNKLQRNVSLDMPYGCFDTVGAQTISVGLFGKYSEIDVTVKENLIDSISIKEDVDKSIIITVNNNNSASYDVKLLDVVYFWAEDDVIHTPIITDKGIFDAAIFTEDNSFAIGLGNINSDDIVKSNILSESEWYDVARLIREDLTYPLLILKNGIEHFKGKITSDNIDKIIEAAGYINNLWYQSNEIVLETGDGAIYKGESIRKEILKYFALENIDLSLSENYDPATDTYKFRRDGFGGYGFDRPFSLVYSNGMWNVEMSVFEEDSEITSTLVYLKLDDDHKIVSFDVNYPYISQLNIVIPQPIIGEEIPTNYRPDVETIPSENANNIELVCSWLVSNDGLNYTLCNAGDKFENGKYYALYNGAGTVNGTDKDTVWLCNDRVYTTTSILWEGEATDVIFTTGKLIDYICGDLDGDNEVTDWDGVLLARYLAGWNVEITTLDALDIDGDGEITDWDGVVLDRYLAGWNVSIG